jgi:GWxTD domain-containing protein
MDPESQGRYLSPAVFTEDGELRELARTGPGEFRSTCLRMWKKRDPDPATRVNERLVEHLARVAFADFHFSVPRLNRPGSLTARGEVYIRYGPPRSWHYDPFGTGTPADRTVMSRPPGEELRTALELRRLREMGSAYRSRPLRLEKTRWTWDYGDFTLNFEDTFHNGDFDFPYERDWSAYTYAYVEKHIPEIYISHIRKRMKVVVDALNVLGRSGQPQVKIIYACDTRGVRYRPDMDWPEAAFSIEIAMLDSTYRDKVRSEFTRALQADSGAVGLSRYPMTGALTLRVPPGPSIAAVSISSLENESRGHATREFEVRRLGPGPTLSDIEMRFVPDRSPNPAREYQAGATAYAAFDIYNLSTGPGGVGEAEVSYSIMRLEEEHPVLKRLLSLLPAYESAPRTRRITSLASSYTLRTRGDRAVQSLGIDLGGLTAGEYEVALKAVDLSSGISDSVSTTLVVVSETGR